MPLAGFFLSRDKARLRLIIGGPDPRQRTERSIGDLHLDVMRRRFLPMPREFNSVGTIPMQAYSTLVGLLSSLPAPMVIRLRAAAAGTHATKDLFFLPLSAHSRWLREARRT